MMIVNYDSRVVNKLEASLTGDARVVIYDRHMFIVQAIDCILALLNRLRSRMELDLSLSLQLGGPARTGPISWTFLKR